jgi:hypothetical protein
MFFFAKAQDQSPAAHNDERRRRRWCWRALLMIVDIDCWLGDCLLVPILFVFIYLYI